jgi:prepilin-type N-terminal cleavage/methylation domain-containing protein
MRRSRAFTLVELLVVIAIIALLVSIMVPTIVRVRDAAKIPVCTANLSAIGKGFVQYASLTGIEQFPIIDANASNPEAPLQAASGGSGSSSDDANLLILRDKLGQNAMQNVWLLMTTGVAVEAAFRCPADTGAGERSKDAKRYGWTSLKEFSYGIQYPYDQTGKVNYGAPWRQIDGGVVIMADRNPGGIVDPTKTPSFRHSNHPNSGIATLNKNSSVGFYYSTGDSLAGKDRDEIYANNLDVVGGMPDDKADKTRTGDTDTSITPKTSR